jgi:hypothetical protein
MAIKVSMMTQIIAQVKLDGILTFSDYMGRMLQP